MTRILFASVAAAALLSASACHKSSSPSGGGLDQVNDQFTQAGLKLDPFVPTDAARFGAARCLAGRIEGVDALLCEYGSPEAVSLGKKPAEEWIGGAVTGLAIDHGRSLLALADRARTDPNGKAMHKIARVFQEKPIK